MWRWLKRLVWWAVAAISVVSALISVLKYLEVEPPPQVPLPPPIAPWARRLTEIPPSVLLAVALLGVSVMLISHARRLRRFEASWAEMNERHEAMFRNWIRERRREFDRELGNVTSELHRAQAPYVERLADLERAVTQQLQWIDMTLGGRHVRLTAEAVSFYEGCHPSERQRIEDGVSASGRDSFFADEIRAMAHDEHE
jgi:hypothetical protein